MAAGKWLSGCLVALLVMVLALGAAWWFLLRPMWSAGSDLVHGAKEWATTLDLGEGIVLTTPYTPPADGRLTPAQVEKLVQVQEVFVAEMGDDLGRLAMRLRDAQKVKDGGKPSFKDVAAAYAELSTLLTHAREAQARGVNQAGLSRDEYAFIRRQALAALPMIVDSASLPGLPSLPGMPADGEASAAARANADLLRPHLPLLKKSLGAGRG